MGLDSKSFVVVVFIEKGEMPPGSGSHGEQPGFDRPKEEEEEKKRKRKKKKKKKNIC